jgi:F1F0 ATPase subunit 2
MSSREAWVLALSLAGGGLLGALYFGGLWWSVRRGVLSARPAGWFFGSLIVRLSVAMAGFYLASRSGAGAFLTCLAGFIAVRVAMVRRARQGLTSLEVRRAP